MLLSSGTRCALDTAACKVSAWLLSPSALTLISTLGWASSGVHWSGPTLTDDPEAMLPATESCAVAIGFQ